MTHAAFLPNHFQPVGPAREAPGGAAGGVRYLLTDCAGAFDCRADGLARVRNRLDGVAVCRYPFVVEGPAMEEELRKAIKTYQERHPEVQEILRKFRVSQEAYERALAAISMKVKIGGRTYGRTTEGPYNANVSGAAR